MAASSILAFWAVGLFLIVVPGADWAFTVSSGLRGRSVLPAVGGLVIGYVVVTLVVAAGVGALVAESPVILTGLTSIGGAYLVWHGAMTLAHPSTPTADGDAHVGTAWATLWRGAGVSGLNPKGLLILLALLPQFTDRHDSWPVAVQIGVLGLVFVASCGVFYACLGTFARTVLHTRPALARAVSRFSGAAMIVIGLVLVADRIIA
jgi:threonine/homoserine/homoserine lactone efflux protein